MKCDWNEMSPEEQYNFLKNVYASMTECEMRMAQMRVEASAEVEPGRSELGEGGRRKRCFLRSEQWKQQKREEPKCMPLQEEAQHNPQATQNRQ